MGPFELMDLVGVDVGFEVSKSFWEQSFHEPRWQPHPIQAKMGAAGRHGRKAGRGYYGYEDGPHRPDDPPPPPATQDPAELPDGGVVEALDVQLISLRDGSLADLSPRPEEVGWFALPPVAEAPLVELTRGPATTDEQAAEAELHFGSRGKYVEWVGDSPGLVLGRIVSQLVNEAAFALGKGIGTAEDIDTAMRLGFNYPHGPLGWGAAIGYANILATLDALRRELGEERYRAAPLLRRMAASG
jgi:3-hydroxybutyryl-CoA dehydrogenase